MHIAMIPGDCIRTSSCMTRKRICLYDARALQMTPQTQHVPAPSVGHSVCLHGHSGFASAQLDFLGIHRSPWSHKGGQSYTAHHGHTKADKRYSPWSHKGGQSDSQGRHETTTSEGTERETGTPAGTRDRRLVQHVFQRTRKDTGSCNTCLSGQGRTSARTAQ